MSLKKTKAYNLNLLYNNLVNKEILYPKQLGYRKGY